jgi:hypothetical protein
MVRSRAVLAIILVGAGLVWIGQGTGLLQGNSFMVGDMRWAVIGAGCLVVGLALAIRQVTARPS